MSVLLESIKRLNTGDPDETVRLVFDDLAVPPKWREVFYPAVRNECRLVARNVTRFIEQGGGDHASSGNQRSIVASSRSDLLAEHFFNGEKFVSWGDATVADHEGRIAMQARLRDGINDDIERHRLAIAEIQAAGVLCLNEIDNEAA